MTSADVWGDPRTWVAICGFLFGILSFFWNRREGRLEALGKILQPMVKAAQEMHAANGCRYKCEQLKASFPQPEKAPEAVQRVNMFVADYGDHIKASRNEFRLAEAEFASRSFRFPDRVSALVQKAMSSLSEFGIAVNDGAFAQGDLLFAKFQDDFRQVSKVGRGWRLADPLEGIKRHFRKPKPQKEADKYGIGEKEMQAIMALIHKRATSQARNTFAVHPPRKLLEHPEIAHSDKVIEELEDSIFVVAFQDGISRMMTLPELMVFTFNLIVLAQQSTEVARMVEAIPNPPDAISVTFRLCVDDIMRPEMVKALLAKIEFSKEPSDAETEPK